MKRRKTLYGKYGPWALITGASDGIGQAFAETLAQERFNLILVARRQDRLQQLAERLAGAYPMETLCLELDLAVTGAVSQMFERVEGKDIGLAVLAAGFGTSGHFIDSDLEQELKMIDVNCRVVVETCHRLAGKFKNRPASGVILMSSLVGFQGVPLASNYAATKAFVQSLAEGLRIEWQSHGIDVLACAPGPIFSGFGQVANMKMAMGQHPQVVPFAALKALSRQTTVRPGGLAKLLGWSLATLPRWGRTKILQQVMAGMTAHQGKKS